MNKPDTKLDECIFVAEKIIPADLCDYVIQDLNIRSWQPHEWCSTITYKTITHKTKELDIQFTTLKLQKLLEPIIIEAGTLYNKTYAYEGIKTGSIMHNSSTLRFNRYSPGQIMRHHMDHIKSLFDGKHRGIPVLSFILNLNDDYEGGDLFFWKDTVVPLGKGDICMFPSNFLFPHGVTELTKGKRYSAVCWGW